jgi:hypothetical protein
VLLGGLCTHPGQIAAVASVCVVAGEDGCVWVWVLAWGRVWVGGLATSLSPVVLMERWVCGRCGRVGGWVGGWVGVCVRRLKLDLQVMPPPAVPHGQCYAAVLRMYGAYDESALVSDKAERAKALSLAAKRDVQSMANTVDGLTAAVQNAAYEMWRCMTPPSDIEMAQTWQERGDNLVARLDTAMAWSREALQVAKDAEGDFESAYDDLLREDERARRASAPRPRRHRSRSPVLHLVCTPRRFGPPEAVGVAANTPPSLRTTDARSNAVNLRNAHAPFGFHRMAPFVWLESLPYPHRPSVVHPRMGSI